mgnify:FL=1
MRGFPGRLVICADIARCCMCVMTYSRGVKTELRLDMGPAEAIWSVYIGV